ncbi:uncharacterized protein LOC111711219 isoform X2 [Eurytemora carolleeae]|nr:uncharacterized protein LOC111711219 isoform X2 [Eurytemora carolleeae]XP_023341278.1 uncharacterized protein LOC111711219 isoform X2 [Eurytemora carolleeae]|eukprot:XP_023341276.1 uncharacterized protein LOC111711219 isoform X2 [Eurytemora affinis]
MRGHVFAVILLTLAVALAAPQDDEEGLAEDLKELNKVGDTPLESALRCGFFYANEYGKPPIERMFIFNATWSADECPTEESVPRWIEFCSNLYKKLEGRLVYENPSIDPKRAKKGVRIGDDICGLLNDRYKVPFVGRKQNSKRYPDGVKIGMYANGCGNVDWIDTGLRHPMPVCCIKGKYDPCEA